MQPYTAKAECLPHVFTQFLNTDVFKHTGQIGQVRLKTPRTSPKFVTESCRVLGICVGGGSSCTQQHVSFGSRSAIHP